VAPGCPQHCKRSSVPLSDVAISLSWDIDALRDVFCAQNELLVIENFLRKPVLNVLLEQLSKLRGAVHRNYIPRHKKGGSISRYQLDRLALPFGELYRHPELLHGLNGITRRSLLTCPATDPHAYALYYYTEPGDHIGWHYDTSYYRGERYTVLIGLVDRSSSRLEFQQYRDCPGRKPETGSLALAPGTLVLFNGDKLYHRVTPLGAGEERIALTLEYLTDPSISPFQRFVSNMKDAIAYFGFRGAFGRRQTG
jgi:hypothetical protein